MLSGWCWMGHGDELEDIALKGAGAPLVSLAAVGQLADRHQGTIEDGVFNRPPPATGNYFTTAQRATLDSILMQLFPADGDGPSARDLNALPYLEWAITDRVNLNDGDPGFIARHVGRLDELSITAYGARFVELADEFKEEVLQRIAGSESGEKLLSLLLFYLTEALMLDPYYGANPDMIGWLWLEHRPGFPRPVEGKSYLDFE